MPNTTYKINEHVICKGKGVAEITDIIKREDIDFYVLRFFHEDFEVKIPTTNNDSIRRPILKKEVVGLFEFLEVKDLDIKKENWNKRSKKYTDKLRNGSIYDIADIIRELNASKNIKTELSFGEKKIFEKAKELIVQELALFEDFTTDELNLKIDACLAN